MHKKINDLLEIDSHCSLDFKLLVGEERCGVTRALLDMHIGGREEGMDAKFLMKGRM